MKKHLKTLLNKLYIAWVLTVFWVFMFIYLPGILIPFMLGEKYGNISYKFLKLWSWTFSKLNRISYEIVGRHNIQDGAYIYISNHGSYLDIPGVCLTVPNQIRPLAKRELQLIPIFGWIVKHATVVVDRSSNESRKKSMNHLKGVLMRGISILIFPEGTQNRTSDPLQPFYDGGFRIAIETQQPILPMVIIGAGELMPPAASTIKPGHIKIILSESISTIGMTLADVHALKEKTFDRMKEMMASEQRSKAQTS